MSNLLKLLINNVMASSLEDTNEICHQIVEVCCIIMLICYVH